MRKIFLSLLVLISVSGALPSMVLAFTLPDTGQTKCYATADTEIACSGTGQDGAYNINPMSFTDNGNGTIMDNVTGLMWQKGENATSYNWYQASGTYDATYNPTSQSVCGSLTLGGHSDWRLPAKKELITIVDYSMPYPGPVINTTYFQNTYANDYWLSTTDAISTGGSAWNVYFNNGIVASYTKHAENYVRCVRGTTHPTPSFTDNGNGTVTDNVTGLMWQQGDPGKTTWAEALSYCEGLSLAGQTDWRLPNIKELESITDNTKFNPAIDKTYFSNTHADVGRDGYWSSTPDASDTYYAFDVGFYYGDVNSHNKSYNNYVRCVRGESRSSNNQNNCAATISSSLAVYVPIITYGVSNYWASLQYNTATGQLTVADSGAVTSASSYSGCTASTLSSDFKLHIPALTYSGATYSVDLQWNGSSFDVTSVK